MTDAELILEAARTAAEAHAGQLRKGTSGAPYINHPIAVARMVAGETEDATVIAAALLHDVVEETAIDAAALRARFGDRVAGLVAEVTDTPELEALSRRERKKRQAEHMSGASREARLIKLADQTSNLEDLAREPEAQDAADHEEYRMGAVGVVDRCRDASPALAARFEKAVAAHEAAVAALGEEDR
jgi:(p)ppGpp synthase/HD superfamily hydrolase